MKSLRWVIIAALFVGAVACEKKGKKNTVAVAPPVGQEQCVYNAQTGQYTSSTTGQICQQNQNWFYNQQWQQGGYWNNTTNPIQPYPYQWVNYQYVPVGCSWGLTPVYDSYSGSYYCVDYNYYQSGGFDWWISLHLNL